MAKVEEYSESKRELSGWPVTIVTYKLESTYHSTIDNQDPGAWVVKAKGSSKQEAEAKALAEAEALLVKVRKSKPPGGCISVSGF